jgi:hypothetical protein
VLEGQDKGAATPRTPEEITAAIDPIIEFVRAGLGGLPAPT